MNVLVECAGGLELLFGGMKKMSVVLEQGASIRDLLQVLKTQHLRERPELFMQDQTIRPGILVLVNEVDWELEGGLDCVVKEGDSVLLISTLHGG